MSLESHSSDFVDPEFQGARRNTSAAPTRQDMDAKVTDVQSELARLRQEQEQLERERVALEETRRRQAERQTGRTEVIQCLTPGIGLLEKAEFDSRQEAEQMAKTLNGLKTAIQNVQAISEENWTKDNFQNEITRSLTALENARMEWNSAQLKHLILTANPDANPALATPDKPALSNARWLAEMDFMELCRLGLALTWPIALAGLGILVVLLLRGK